MRQLQFLEFKGKGSSASLELKSELVGGHYPMERQKRRVEGHDRLLRWFGGFISITSLIFGCAGFGFGFAMRYGEQLHLAGFEVRGNNSL